MDGKGRNEIDARIKDIHLLWMYVYEGCSEALGWVLSIIYMHLLADGGKMNACPGGGVVTCDSHRPGEVRRSPEVWMSLHPSKCTYLSNAQTQPTRFISSTLLRTLRSPHP